MAKPAHILLHGTIIPLNEIPASALLRKDLQARRVRTISNDGTIIEVHAIIRKALIPLNHTPDSAMMRKNLWARKNPKSSKGTTIYGRSIRCYVADGVDQSVADALRIEGHCMHEEEHEEQEAAYLEVDLDRPIPESTVAVSMSPVYKNELGIRGLILGRAVFGDEVPTYTRLGCFTADAEIFQQRHKCPIWSQDHHVGAIPLTPPLKII